MKSTPAPAPGSGPVIEVIISPDGQTRIQTRGFTGASCKQATKFLEQALGQIQSDQPTAEFYQSQSQEEHRRQSAG